MLIKLAALAFIWTLPCIVTLLPINTKSILFLAFFSFLKELSFLYELRRFKFGFWFLVLRLPSLGSPDRLLHFIIVFFFAYYLEA